MVSVRPRPALLPAERQTCCETLISPEAGADHIITLMPFGDNSSFYTGYSSLSRIITDALCHCLRG